MNTEGGGKHATNGTELLYNFKKAVIFNVQQFLYYLHHPLNSKTVGKLHMVLEDKICDYTH